jgi:hypothetical protein
VLASLVLFVAAMAPAVSAAESNLPIPLRQAHAHNDYEHARPLLDALEHGFCSVEADIWLVNGQLLVAHDLKNANPGRTFQALYLDPLRERVVRNGGKVFRGGPTFTLIIDVKSDATNTYLALRDALRSYASMLTMFPGEKTETNAVTVIVSGNRARGLMATETNRLAAYDGRLVDLDSGDSPQLIPLISDNWTLHFKWRARADEGPLPDAERAKLRQLVERAHQQGRRLRLWATPDRPAMWQELYDAGVDLINTDDLAGLEKFLLGRSSRK